MKQSYDLNKAIGYWIMNVPCASNFLLLDIEYGIDDIAVVKWPNEKVTRHIIKYTAKGVGYITKFGRRYRFDECVRYN